MLAASGITAEHAVVRGYETITDKRWFDTRKLKITPAGPQRARPAGAAAPRPTARTWGYQYRPDNPRLRGGKLVKYETPWQQRNGLDVPPGVAADARRPGDPAVDHRGRQEGRLRRAARAVHRRAVRGVELAGHQHRRRQDGAARVARHRPQRSPRHHRVRRRHDPQGVGAEGGARAWPTYLATKGARVEFLHLPDTDDKTGLDDYLMAGHTVEDLWKLVKPHQPRVRERPRSHRRHPSRRGSRSRRSPWPRRTPSSTAGSARTTTPTPSTPCWPPPRSRGSRRQRPGVAARRLRARQRQDRDRAGVRRRRCHRDQLDHPARPRCCRRHPNASAPRTPPAGCCAGSATAACWSSRTSPRSCR